MISIFKKKVKPSFSREIVPNEKSFCFIDMKGIPNKENINNKNLIISKIPKKKKQAVLWSRGLQLQ